MYRAHDGARENVYELIARVLNTTVTDAKNLVYIARKIGLLT